MNSPTPIDRRAWRLGFLLTGNPDSASSLLALIRGSPKSPSDPALLDRFIIQHARSLPRSDPLLPSTPTSSPTTLAAAQAALSAALKLSRQPQESWVLKRLDDLDDLHIARAMDCSKTAARTHLAAADESMSARLADRLTPSIAALRDYTDSLDPAPLISAYQQRRHSDRALRLKKIALASAAAILLLAFIALKLFLTGSPI